MLESVQLVTLEDVEEAATVVAASPHTIRTPLIAGCVAHKFTDPHIAP